MRKPPRRILVRVLIGLGSVFAALAIFAVWAERQALDTDEWVETSSELFEDEEIQAALQSYLVDQLFAHVDVPSELQRGLPADAQPLAAPLSAAVQQLADDAAKRVLDSPRLADAWVDANREAHTLLLDLVEGDGELVEARGGVVTLDLSELLDELTRRLGIGADVASRLPADVAELEILSSDEIETAQRIAEAIRGLALILSLATLAALALAVYLARGRRQLTLLWAGFALIGAGIAVYALRALAGDALVDSLVENESAVPAAEAAWSISTSLLNSIATTVIVLGALLSIASWLGSPVDSAAAVRRSLAPALRDRPGIFYGLLATVALLYFVLAPSHGLRVLLTVIALALLAGLGIRALRRQAVAEFPDARAGETLADLRHWASGLFAGRRAGAQAAKAPEDERLERLERLARLREQGVLTDEELAAEKARILGAG